MHSLYCLPCSQFDIRQWVLVTDWNPLTIWFYEESYVRFSAEDFDMSKLDNKLIHLTNNSVTKHAGKEEETEEIIGNMWTCQQLEDHFKVAASLALLTMFSSLNRKHTIQIFSTRR